MSFEHYIRSGSRMLRLGYTTGTCAALAAKAATMLLLEGKAPDQISFLTKRDILVTVPVERAGTGEFPLQKEGEITPGQASDQREPKGSACDIPLQKEDEITPGQTSDQSEPKESTGDIPLQDKLWQIPGEIAGGKPEDNENNKPRRIASAWASVRKDAGDDPDVTDGIEIAAVVKRCLPSENKASASNSGERKDDRTDGAEADELHITIDGGFGVGRVKKEGLQQPVGAAAINRSPREMIAEAVRSVCKECGVTGEFCVEIVVPEGKEIAGKTFNPSIGIEDGISILGTTGVEYPMSEAAMIKSIEMELHRAALTAGRVILTPGNYGESFIKENGLNPGELPVVRFSGYLGEALDICALEEITEVMLVSHVGKLVKTAGGIMNTHQKNADCRMELFCAHAAINGADTETCIQLMNQSTADGCIDILEKAGLRETVLASLMSAVMKYLKRRIDGAYHIRVVMFSNKYGILGQME